MASSNATGCPEPERHAVLVVEDEVIVAEALGEALAALGYVVVGVAASATEAVRLADAHRPSVILMDIALKGETDGIEAARVIRGRTGAPVIFLTAFSDADTLGRATQISPSGHLVKPFREPELRRALEVALQTHADPLAA